MTVTTKSFAQRVADAVAQTGPLCVGVDPSSTLLAEWGLPDSGPGLREFSLTCVEAFAGAVSAIKAQVAFFERHGSAGMSALEVLMARAREAGLLVIADAKRGDVDSTMAAYAGAWVGDGSPLAADAVTASPYLGVDALEPMFTEAGRTGRGVLVVARSSNPQGRPLQLARLDGGETVEHAVLGAVAGWNASRVPAGTVGAVVGATLPASEFPLAQLGGVVLAPGVGAQGADPSDVGERFAGCLPGSVLPSASRSVLGTGPEVAQLRKTATDLSHELATYLD